MLDVSSAESLTPRSKNEPTVPDRQLVFRYGSVVQVRDLMGSKCVFTFVEEGGSLWP